MSKRQLKFSSKVKPKTVLEAIWERTTTQKLAVKYEVHPKWAHARMK